MFVFYNLAPTPDLLETYMGGFDDWAFFTADQPFKEDDGRVSPAPALFGGDWSAAGALGAIGGALGADWVYSRMSADVATSCSEDLHGGGPDDIPWCSAQTGP